MEKKKETTVPAVDKEMNFLDLCVAIGRVIGRGCVAAWHLLEHMLRLTYRYWWIVLTLVVLAVAASLYYTRRANTIYKVNAVALINGGSIQQFDQAFAPLQSMKMLPPDAAITPLVLDRKVTRFETYRVIDALHDKTPDYIDFKKKVSPTDTVNVRMHDRLCIQFRIKERDLNLLPEVEFGVLQLLNNNPALQQSYVTYLNNLRNEVIFNHTQAQKLDSLTSHYYFYQPSAMEPNAYVGTGVNFYGDRRIRLFLDEIYKQREHMQRTDYRLQLATAPVVLENHFAVDPKPVNGRLKFFVVFFLLGWIAGCCLAEIVDKRKALCAWLKA